MSWFDEAESGLRLAFAILAVVVTLVVLFIGLDTVFLEPRKFLARGLVMLLIAAIAIVPSIRWWAKGFFAVCALGAVRLVIVGIVGREQAFSAAKGQAPRSFFFEAAAVLVVMAVLSYRFVDQRPNWLDSICLVLALATLCYSLISPEHLTWMLMGPLSLGVAFAYGYLRRKLASRAKVA